MVRSGLVLVSVLSGLYSVVAWFGGLYGDAITATVVAVLAGGGVCLVDYLEEEFAARQERLERQWMRDYRGAWFASFERRQRVIAAREAGR